MSHFGFSTSVGRAVRRRGHRIAARGRAAGDPHDVRSRSAGSAPRSRCSRTGRRPRAPRRASSCRSTRACTVSASARVRTSMFAASAALILAASAIGSLSLRDRGVVVAGRRRREQDPARAATDDPASSIGAKLSLSSMNMMLAAHRAERRPPARADRVTEARVGAAHVVGRDELVGREHRADLGVERVERRRRDRGVLHLDVDHDRHVARVRVRPRLHRPQAQHEREARRVRVDVGLVDDLEPGLVHDRRVGRRQARATAATTGARTCRPCGSDHTSSSIWRTPSANCCGQRAVRVVEARRRRPGRPCAARRAPAGTAGRGSCCANRAPGSG